MGSTHFKNEYIDGKVQKWVNNIKTLANIAKAQPHAAYAAFIHGEQHKYTYFLRTLAHGIIGVRRPPLNFRPP